MPKRETRVVLTLKVLNTFVLHFQYIPHHLIFGRYCFSCWCAAELFSLPRCSDFLLLLPHHHHHRHLHRIPLTPFFPFFVTFFSFFLRKLSVRKFISVKARVSQLFWSRATCQQTKINFMPFPRWIHCWVYISQFYSCFIVYGGTHS